MKVDIPISKSCYARIAMISAIAGIDIPYSDENDDIIAIREALTTTDDSIWVHSSGTAARFAIAYYASKECDVVIDGSDQMRKRPISSIIEAAKAMGAEIEGNSLPIRIKGRIWTNREIEVDASQSSQTISALMIAGMRRGLKITTKGERNSWSYVELTAAIMKRFGVEIEISDKFVKVGEMGEICNQKADVDKDWSSAAFWYGWCLTRKEEIEIAGLKRGSCQPDEAAVEIFGKLGVVSEETSDGIKLRLNSTTMAADIFEADCRRTPDLAMVLIPALCKTHTKFNVTGLETLERKESRRGSALCTELRKAGYDVAWNGESMSWNGNMITIKGKPDVYGDHRMVMALMILGIEDINYEPLGKSYPELKRAFLC